MQEQYHLKVTGLDPEISDRKHQEEKCSSTIESNNDSYREQKKKVKRIKEKET